MKGIANQHGIELWLDIQQWYGVALTGKSTGAVFSSESITIRRRVLYK